eukprot:scpid63375/ scgid17432/ Probable tRNA(His) guanylyltransferase; tRNA-histidine guanylyltransferase
MAKSKYEYVKQFETCEKCLRNTWVVIRLDGRSFHRFSDSHGFEKPNDYRCIALMARCAREVMQEFTEIVLAYGQSDEFSFVLRPSCNLFGRRATKLATCMASYFASSFVFHWTAHFEDVRMQYPVTFDGRAVCYPTVENLRDYLCWRQADCHINNLYNTVFWSLVKKGLTGKEAETKLCGTVSSDKNEILFTECNINYSKEPDVARKGTTFVWEEVVEEVPLHGPSASTSGSSEVTCLDAEVSTKHKEEGKPAVTQRKRKRIAELHCDIIGDQFWAERPALLAR